MPTSSEALIKKRKGQETTKASAPSRTRSRTNGTGVPEPSYLAPRVFAPPLTRTRKALAQVKPVVHTTHVPSVVGLTVTETRPHEHVENHGPPQKRLKKSPPPTAPPTPPAPLHFSHTDEWDVLRTCDFEFTSCLDPGMKYIPGAACATDHCLYAPLRLAEAGPAEFMKTMMAEPARLETPRVAMGVTPSVMNAPIRKKRTGMEADLIGQDDFSPLGQKHKDSRYGARYAIPEVEDLSTINPFIPVFNLART
ncbi:hypothetical protein SISSUDRAFT_151812 [Sistotremastrum suecicum HHB10207 ss-3]|uniref:Uncharacterized protein n=1 Tax=Sistotremastrum suecicum HHB10207 ss-3 TaxID=1314776 RepID=A0A166AS55_9AGAM|nr:hypothetical protein SISSUDRAFT_151812 [Sistotremastrum suecicum HHB10207 ss-3]